MFARKLTILLLAAAILSLGGAACAFDLLSPWGYVWVNGAHYKTNLDSLKFDSDLLRVESKIGVNLMPLWAQASVQPYLVYYGVASADKHSYYNNSVSGIGVQVMPLLGIGAVDWLQDLKVFCESLSISFSNKDEDDPLENPDDNYKWDTKAGLEIWHVWNEPGVYTVENRGMLWSELWAQIAYRNTNFEYDNGERFNNYMLYFQPKVGIYLWKFFNNVSIEPYLKADIMTSGKSDYYRNNAAYGGGLRVRPLLSGDLFGMDVQYLKKLKFFVEVLAVSYLKDNPPDGEDFINHDFRVGVDFDYGR